jgi:hypothetical protein
MPTVTEPSSILVPRPCRHPVIARTVLISPPSSHVSPLSTMQIYDHFSEFCTARDAEEVNYNDTADAHDRRDGSKSCRTSPPPRRRQCHRPGPPPREDVDITSG